MSTAICVVLGLAAALVFSGVKLIHCGRKREREYRRNKGAHA